MLNTKPSLPVRTTYLLDELEENLRNVSDSRLYRMIYIEPGRYSPDEIKAAQLEMDHRAVPIKVVSGFRPDQPVGKNRKRPFLKKGSLFDPENLAPFAAMMGLIYIAIGLIFHWGNHKKIWDNIGQAFFWLVISAVVYMYLIFRSKPTKPTRRK